ncbi:serine/threonine-protein kinase [Aporhodopirellula aestuarii]|uniref:Protein kinase n=1 Tax=Aporhodopirellula aestuarii TaxID=2950107 RepID=A0ABT0TZF7_9BACT|nr:serine/threonine-protein kinase [Aporhodopirellula aestuarii]MCM2369960.1 protein kinase [Aporhodopirellula aestuarii]
MDFSSISDLSIEPATTGGLSLQQKQRLTFLLDQYLIALESGAPPSIDDLAIEDPDLVAPLRSYITGLEDLHHIAAGFVPQGQVDNAEASETSEKILGDFRLLEEIGRGGMGVVYRAQQISLGRIVAIKLLPFASVLDARQIARFNNEAQAAAQLHHPNIVPVYTVGSVRGVHYYAMQFIDGQSFDEVIANQNERGSLPEINDVVAVGIQIADALHVAHQFGVIHRDIKPSNVMLDRDGKVWVTDFGLARCQSDATLTKTGDIVGTMRYMSPEQARGESAIVDGRTDVYSLGATLYEMLCLQPAFDGGDAPAILRHVDERNAPLLRTVRPDVPRDLETVIAKAMAKTRDGRYDTAADFAVDLRHVLAGEPTIARPPTLVDRLSQWAVRHRRIVTLTLAVIVVALIGLSVSNALISAAKRESDMNAMRAANSDRLSRAAVDRLGAQMAELLADVPGADSVRRQLLQETLAYYEDFANQASDDPGLMHDLAITYGKIGSIQSEVGSMDEAVASLERSRQLFERRLAADPSDRTRQHELATGENNLALALEQAGRYEAAMSRYLSAIEREEKLIADDPSDIDATLSLSLSLNNLGLLLGKAKQFEQAESVYRRSIELAESIDEESRTPTLEHQLASAYQNLSGLLMKSDPSRAVHYAQTALQNQMKDLSADPSNPKTASRVALTLNSLGAAQSEAGDMDASIDSYQQAISLQSQLLDRWPDQLSYQRDIAVTQNNYGMALVNRKRFDEARDAFKQSLAFQISLADLFTSDADLQSTLGGVYNNLGFVQEQLGEAENAMGSYRSAVIHQSLAHNAAPEVPQYREFLSKHYFNHAKLLSQAGRVSEAIDKAMQRRALWEGNGERLAGVVDELLAIAERIPAGGSSDASHADMRADCLESAKETLQMAIDAGFDPPEELLDRPVYESLRSPFRLDRKK